MGYSHYWDIKRPLTDAESREIGIGPVCRAKRGW